MLIMKSIHNIYLMCNHLGWYCFFANNVRVYSFIKTVIMRKPDKNAKDTSQAKSRLHTPQTAQTTTPVNLKSGDKLRENPANDEETIEQDPRKTSGGSGGKSPLSREHDGGRNQITNEDDQKDIVNPTGG